MTCNKHISSRNFCNLQGPKKIKTSPNIDGFYRNCSCISMYISCISSKTSSHKSAPGLLFWNTTRTQKTGPTNNSICRKCYGISPLLGLLFHGHFMTCKQKVTEEIYQFLHVLHSTITYQTQPNAIFMAPSKEITKEERSLTS